MKCDHCNSDTEGKPEYGLLVMYKGEIKYGMYFCGMDCYHAGRSELETVYKQPCPGASGSFTIKTNTEAW